MRQKKKNNKLRLEEITAYDHWSRTGWGEDPHDEIVSVVGYFIGEDRNHVYLAGWRAEDGGIANISAVLKKVIIKRRQIRT